MANRMTLAVTTLSIAVAMGVGQTVLSLVLGDTHVVSVPATSLLAYGPESVVQDYIWATTGYAVVKWTLAAVGAMLLVPTRMWLTLRLALRR